MQSWASLGMAGDECHASFHSYSLDVPTQWCPVCAMTLKTNKMPPLTHSEGTGETKRSTFGQTICPRFLLCQIFPFWLLSFFNSCSLLRCLKMYLDFVIKRNVTSFISNLVSSKFTYTICICIHTQIHVHTINRIGSRVKYSEAN